VFLLGEDCSFSVSARECSGYIGNCILFIDSRDKALVFNLKDHGIHEIDFCNHLKRFWPPEHGIGGFSPFQNGPENIQFMDRVSS
jgi:hypothetical protein